MPRKVTFKGNPVTLVGRVLKIGMRAPDFKLVSADSKEVRLSDFSRSENELESGKRKNKAHQLLPFFRYLGLRFTGKRI